MIGMQWQHRLFQVIKFPQKSIYIQEYYEMKSLVSDKQ